jgi:hypothetical protein
MEQTLDLQELRQIRDKIDSETRDMTPKQMLDYIKQRPNQVLQKLQKNSSSSTIEKQ